jgi:UDP-N-acetylglucosamine acyltransferase
VPPDPRAVLDESRGAVELADDVEVGPFAVLIGPLRIGPGSRIGASAVIGAHPKKRGALPRGCVTLGAFVAIGEHAVIDAATTDAGVTIDEHAMILPHVYVGHDARIGRQVTIAAHARLGGRVALHEGCNVGLGAALHQSCTLGAYAMVGMQAAVSRDVPPFGLARGVPARLRGLNRVGAARLDLSPEAIDRIRAHHAALREGILLTLDPEDPIDLHFARFVADSRRGCVH